MTWGTDLGIETTPAGLSLGRGTWGAHLFIAGATLA